MKSSHFLTLFSLFAAAPCVHASAVLPAKPFAAVKRQASSTNDSLSVDLGYAVYQGVENTTTKVNTWLGIRFAAPPVGALRWQAPQPPPSNRSSVQQANQYGPICPQSSDATGVPSNFTAQVSTEDCLYLNVFAPTGATNLPVFVTIHGGGYGAGDGRQDLTALINSQGGNFVGVVIQYRLGAFGFLSSDEVFRNGIVNAGILDQHFALQWVQAYISQFGGDPTQVTIAGESAGGGSVMLQDMAYGGSIGNSLFVNSIVASPYLPMQYGHSDWVPSQSYYAFATQAGCAPNTAYGSSPQTIFACLVAKDTDTLQAASFNISASGTYGTWGFLPVTDGVFVQQLPSQQLLRKQVNGLHILSGNNANEGPSFVPQTINTIDALLDWLHLTFPLFTTEEIAKILLYYPASNTTDPIAPDFATDGLIGATALNESQVGTGNQQRADNIYAETTFVCPSYWLAEAFSGSAGRSAYKYQYSVPVATHGADVRGYYGPATPEKGPDFEMAFMGIYSNFITTSNPSISAELANGASSNDTAAANPITDWPVFSAAAPYQINLNETGGTPVSVSLSPLVPNVTEFVGPGLRNDFTLVNAYTWEGGRGTRCDFWRSMGVIVPE